MNPEVMTRIVKMVTPAQVHRLRITGKTNRAARIQATSIDAAESQRPQSMGALYGIGTGVKLDICAANSFASFPLAIQSAYARKRAIWLPH